MVRKSVWLLRRNFSKTLFGKARVRDTRKGFFGGLKLLKKRYLKMIKWFTKVSNVRNKCKQMLFYALQNHSSRRCSIFVRKNVFVCWNATYVIRFPLAFRMFFVSSSLYTLLEQILCAFSMITLIKLSMN